MTEEHMREQDEMNEARKEEKLDAAIETLEDAAGKEGTELGEAWDLLARLKSYVYCFTPEFSKALKREILDHANVISKEYKWVDEEIVVPEAKRKVRRFVHISELEEEDKSLER